MIRERERELKRTTRERKRERKPRNTSKLNGKRQRMSKEASRERITGLYKDQTRDGDVERRREREQKARTHSLSRNWFDGSIVCLPATTIATTTTAREFRWHSSAHVRRPRFSHFHSNSSYKYYRSGNHRKQQQEKTATETQK